MSSGIYLKRVSGCVICSDYFEEIGEIFDGCKPDIKSNLEWLGFSVKEIKNNFLGFDAGICYELGIGDEGVEVSNHFIGFIEKVAPFMKHGTWIEIESPEGASRIVYKNKSFEWITPEVLWENEEKRNTPKVEYVSDFSLEDLNEKVLKMLKEGWILSDQLTSVVTQTRTKSFGSENVIRYIQRMIYPS